jgi:hypothetical protein
MSEYNTSERFPLWLPVGAAVTAAISGAALPLAAKWNMGIYSAIVGHFCASVLLVQYRVYDRATGGGSAVRGLVVSLIYLAYVTSVAFGFWSEIVNFQLRVLSVGMPVLHTVNDVAFILFLIQLLVLRRWVEKQATEGGGSDSDGSFTGQQDT